MMHRLLHAVVTIVVLSVLLWGTAPTGAAATTTHGVQKYTCVFDGAPETFPDGTTGLAEVGVKITGSGTTVVQVDYFSDGYMDYLGAYQEVNGEVVPRTADEACDFAFDHYDDRQ